MERRSALKLGDTMITKVTQLGNNGGKFSRYTPAPFRPPIHRGVQAHCECPGHWFALYTALSAPAGPTHAWVKLHCALFSLYSYISSAPGEHHPVACQTHFPSEKEHVNN